MRQIAEVMNNMEHIGASMLLLTAVIKLLLTAHPERQGYISGMKSYIEMWMLDDNERGKYRRLKQQGAYDLCEYES